MLEPRSKERIIGESTTVVRRLRRSAVGRPVLFVALVAGVVRVTAALVSFARHDGVLIPDESTYLRLAAIVASGQSAEAYQAGYGQSLYDQTKAFSGSLALLFSVFGPSRIVGQLLAVLFGVVTVAAGTALARRVLSDQWALGAGLVLALWPSQVLWSSVVLRESIVWAALALTALCFAVAVRARGWRQPLWMGAALSALLVVGFVRDQTMVAAAWSFAIAGAVVAVQLRRPPILAGALIALLVVPWLSGAGIAGWSLAEQAVPALGTTRARLSIGAESAITPVAPVRPGATEVGSGAGSEGPPAASGEPAVLDVDGQPVAVDDSAGGTLSRLPAGLVATTFRPWPWEEVTSGASRIASWENLAWYVLYGLAVVGAWAGRRRLDVVAFPIGVTGSVLAIAAITQGNLGTAFRHRGQLLWALAFLAAIGAFHLAQRRTTKRAGAEPGARPQGASVLGSASHAVIGAPARWSLPVRRRGGPMPSSGTSSP